MPEIRVEALRKTFGTERALDEVSFDVHEGEFLTLLGPSGCGKTTTLMSIAGFRHPDAGRITVGERTFFDHSAGLDVAAEDRNLGIVFQSYAIWPHMTVAQNVGFPLKVRKQKRDAVDQQVVSTLKLVEMSEYADRYPHELSGGQQQRVALARALVYHPSVLLLDEPFSNLDAKLRERARTWVKHLQQSLGLTTIFVTHDQDEAMSMSDRILVMDHGVILQTGTPEDVYQKPATRFVAEFLGHCNILAAKVVGAGGGGTRVRLEPTGQELTIDTVRHPVGASIELVVRPEALTLSTDRAAGAENSFSAQVVSTSFLGDHYAHQLDAGGVPLSARSGRALQGTQVTVHVPANGCGVLTDANSDLIDPNP